MAVGGFAVRTGRSALCGFGKRSRGRGRCIARQASGAGYDDAWYDQPPNIHTKPKLSRL